MPKTSRRASDVGVIVGRFQVHTLHDAHHGLITSITATHAKTLIVLGLSQARVSTRNPLDFEARKQMILSAFPEVTVLYIKDEPTDSGWSQRLDTLLSDYLSPAQTVCLYGGRDSFITRYNGKHKTDVLEPDTYASGTEMRKSISRSVKASEDFRAGVIWASANGWPKAFPAVDVAIWRYGSLKPHDWWRKAESDAYHCKRCHVPEKSAEAGWNEGKCDDGKEWLLVRKQTEKKWRFPGGMYTPADPTYEAAARREVDEETGASITDPVYVRSRLVDDWRYRDETDKIVTTLFVAQYISGPVQPADDVAEAQWWPESVAMYNALMPEHQPLWSSIMDWQVLTERGK